MRLDKKDAASSSSNNNNNNNNNNKNKENNNNNRPREDTPLLGGDQTDSLSSQPKTFANVFIAVVGAGVLGLPYTVMKTGWATGAAMILAVAALTHHCMMLLVHTRRRLEAPLSYSKISSFGDLGFAVCGTLGRLAVDSMIVLTQAGFCVGYVIFIGNTLANLYHNNSSPTHPPHHNHNNNNNNNLHAYLEHHVSPKTLYIWACFPFQLGLNAIPTLTLLAPLSIFADIVQIGAMCVVLVEDVIQFMNHMPAVKAFGSLSMFFYGLGVAVYSFEGVGMALPLESETKDKPKFGRVLGLTMLFIAVMYASFGVFGYLAFGENTKDIITSNFGRGLLSTSVQLALCVNLFFTLPLMMNPVFEVFERRYWDGGYCLWMRWLLVLVVILVALLVPNFTDFLSLVGSSVCCILGFVLPPLFHYMTFKDDMGWKGVSSDVGIIVLGVFLGVTGTWSSLAQIFSAKV